MAIEANIINGDTKSLFCADRNPFLPVISVRKGVARQALCNQMKTNSIIRLIAPTFQSGGFVKNLLFRYEI